MDQIGGAALGHGGEEIGGEGTRGVQQPAQIDVDHAVPLLGVGGLVGRAEHHSRVGDDEIDGAEGRGDGAGGGVDGLGVGQVGGHREDGRGGRGAEFVGQGSQTLCTTAEEGDRGPIGGQAAGGGCADAAGGAGYDGDPAGQPLSGVPGVGVADEGGRRRTHGLSLRRWAHP
ncbi:hypothetical protein GCM10010341_57260 [Streptomyces noursei]|nr:hypothetical protein GCM10010341_57260 [Streptomyces noursei]